MTKQETIQTEQIKRITKLLNDLCLADVNQAEFDEIFPNQTIREIKEELWRMHCFADDVCSVLNM